MDKAREVIDFRFTFSDTKTHCRQQLKKLYECGTAQKVW